MSVLQTIAPTPYFLLVSHFQLSLVLVLTGVRFIRGPRGLAWLTSALIMLSAVFFFGVWLWYSGGWTALQGEYVAEEPLVKLLFGPVLAIAAPFVSWLPSKRFRGGYGVLLVAAGLMVATMMILNDVFW